VFSTNQKPSKQKETNLKKLKKALWLSLINPEDLLVYVFEVVLTYMYTNLEANMG
jgi:hypothetical protein